MTDQDYISDIDARHLLGYIKAFRETDIPGYADDCAMEIEQLVLDNLGFFEKCLKQRLGIDGRSA